MAEVTICSDFGAQSLSLFPLFLYCGQDPLEEME